MAARKHRAYAGPYAPTSRRKPPRAPGKTRWFVYAGLIVLIVITVAIVYLALQAQK